MRLHWIISVGPNASTSVLRRERLRETERDRDREGGREEKPQEDRGRDGSDFGHSPRTAWSPQKLEEARKCPLSAPWEGERPWDTSISDSWPPDCEE